MSTRGDRLELVLGKGLDNDRIRRRVIQIETAGNPGGKSAWFRSALLEKIDAEEGGVSGATLPPALTKADILEILEQYIRQAPAPPPVEAEQDSAEQDRAKALFAQAEKSFR